MALFRKLFYRKPPDGLLEISERVFVFDCCFTTDVWEEENYKDYAGGIVTQLREHYPDASILMFNFREGETQSMIANALSEYDMTIMEYPRHYEGCPLLPMEVIHHFLRSCESWLSLGMQNLLLMNCERGGWPVLAFMLAALLIYRKQYSGEHKTLEMVYKQAPRELLHLLSPLNPMPSQLRYLQYVSRRNVATEWPPLDRALTVDCVIIRMIPNFDGEGGCRPIFRVYGQDPLLVSDRAPKVLFSTPKRSRTVRHYKQAECELIKIDINCHIQGDVVLECISLHEDIEREEMMFRVMFNTAFIRSNILMLNRDEIDILWEVKDQFPKDFRAEVLFSEMDAAASMVPVDFSFLEEKDGLPMEAFARVQEIFSSVDWVVQKGDTALEVLQQITLSKAVIEANSHSESPEEIQNAAVLEHNIKSSTDLLSENQSTFSAKISPSTDGDKREQPDSLTPVISLDLTSVPPGEQSPPPTSPSHQLSITKAVYFTQTTYSNTNNQQSSTDIKISPLTETNILSPETFPLARPTQLTKDADIGPGRPVFNIETTLSPHTPHLEDKNGIQSRYTLPLLPPEMPSTSTPTLKDDSTVPSDESIPSLQAPLNHDNVMRDRPPKPATPPSAASSSADVGKDTGVAPLPPPPLRPPPTNLHSTVDAGISAGAKDLPLRTTLPSALNSTEAPRLSSPDDTACKTVDVGISAGAKDIPLRTTLPSALNSTEAPRLSSSPDDTACKTAPLLPPLSPNIHSTSIKVDSGPGQMSPSAPSPTSMSKKNRVSGSEHPPPPPPPPPFTPSLAHGSDSKQVPRPPFPPEVPPNRSSSVRGEAPPPPLPPPPPPPPSFAPVSPVKEHQTSGFVPPPPPPLTPPLMENRVSRPAPRDHPPPPPPLPPSEISSSRGGPPLPPPPPPPSKQEAGPINPSPMSPPPPPPPAPGNSLGRTSNSPPVPLVPPPPFDSHKGDRSLSGSPSPPPPSIPPPGAKGKTLLSRTLTPRNSQTKKLKPLHWLKISRAVSGSLWAEAQKSGEASKAPDIDMSELESLFSTAVSNPDQGGSGRKAGSRASMGHKPEKVQLIDHRRAYNCEIMLSKVKVPLHELLSSVLALEDSALDIDQVENVIKFCPTKEEMEVLKGYKGEKDKLGKCEQFFMELMQVPRIESKLRVFSFKIQFSSQVSDLRNSLNVVNSASDQIRGSAKLKRIMQTILSLGNALNQGTARGSAIGFKLDSLLKLTETRARNNKMTLMHYLCKVLADKLPELLDFWQDLSSLEPASKIQLKYLAEEMQAINKGLEKVMQELSMSENDGPVSDRFRKVLKEFLCFSESEVRSLASLYSGVGRNVDALILYFGEDPARCPFEQVISTLLNFVRMFKKSHEENCKQLESDRKKAEKEASTEKLKTNTPHSGQLLESQVRNVK